MLENRDNVTDTGEQVPPAADTVATIAKASITEVGTQVPQVELYKDDPEIQNLRTHCPVPQISLDWFRADIKIRGCSDSIKYAELEGRNTVLDGYNRIEICDSETPKIPYKIEKLEFDSRQAAINWFIDHQLARRNLTDMQKAFLIGNRYNAEKQPWGGNRSSGHNAHLPKMAKEVKENERTIRRQAEFANGIEKIKDLVGPEFTQRVLSGQTKTTMNTITALSKKTPEEIKAETAKIIQGYKPEKKLPSKDEQFSNFVRRQQACLTTLLDIDKITDSTVNFDQVLETATSIVKEIKKIQANSRI